ncbi:MAG: bifunctional DNA-binding transcriptional regulator/O6-methylguanine-DNA methyltransferase Ada [Acetobacteraceae bacterium]
MERMMEPASTGEGGTTAAFFSTDASRWAAVRARDRRADGSFVISVRTTGVYCRPSCRARPARPENVRFFNTTAEARAAGFRACKRCNPDAAGQPTEAQQAVARACRLIETAEDMPSLEAMARESGLSRFHFHRVFKAATGVTPMAYAAECRARRVRQELGQTATITEAIYAAGYNSNGRFYAEANERLGMTPSAFREGGKGSQIQYAIGACSLGRILVAATGLGVAAIAFGEDDAALEQNLRARFPNAHLTPAPAAFHSTLARVIDAVETPDKGLDLPLDVRGTAFQIRVWQALREIPPGKTASYASIAERIGKPKAARAVAAACAANPLPVAIPCHRVVRSDGGLAGYAYGVERKRALLAREAGQ